MHCVRLQPVYGLCRPKPLCLFLSRSFPPTYDCGRAVLRENRRILSTLQHRGRRNDVDRYRRKKRQGLLARGWQSRKLASPTWAGQSFWAWLIGPFMPSYTSVSCSVGSRSAAAPMSCGIGCSYHSSTVLRVPSGREGEEGENVEKDRDHSRDTQRREDGVGDEESAEQLEGERESEGQSQEKQNEAQSQPSKATGKVSIHVGDNSAPIDASRTGGYSLEELLDNIAKAQKEEVWTRPPKQVKTRRTSVMTIEELVAFLREENAQDICVIKVPPEREYVDYFVVCGGMGTRHIRMMADNLVAEVKGCGDGRGGRVRVEGKDSDSWMVVDLGSMVVHMMLDETRDKFELEKLWTLGPEYDDQLREMHKWLRAMEEVKMN